MSKVYNMLLAFFGNGYDLNTFYKVEIDLSGTECGYKTVK